MPRGGTRPGAGRKSEQELKTIRAAIDNNITPKQWNTIIRKLYALAEKGNIRATQILITYRFGAATAQLNEPEVVAESSPDIAPPREKQYYFPLIQRDWRIEVYPHGSKLVVTVVDEENCDFDDEGNVIISRRRLYPYDDPPPFVRTRDNIYVPTKRST
jgi:hypothetical protein